VYLLAEDGIRGECHEFAGTNSHASEIDRINEAVSARVPEDQIINYRTDEADDQGT
jgi:hypothetical protein